MATTYTEDTTIQAKARVAKAACTTGTEAASVLTTSSTQGILLTGLAGYDVRVESTGSAFTAGSLDAYLQNPLTGKWSRARDMDVPVAASTGEAFVDFRVDREDGSRLAFLPNGLGQANEIYIIGQYRRGLR